MAVAEIAPRVLRGLIQRQLRRLEVPEEVAGLLAAKIAGAEPAARRALPLADQQKYATVAEVMAELGVSRQQVYNLIEAGELVRAKGRVNGMTRITRASVDCYLKGR